LEERATQVLDRLILENKKKPRTWIRGAEMVRVRPVDGELTIEALHARSLRAHIQETTRFEMWRPSKDGGNYEATDLSLSLCEQVIHKQKDLNILRRVARYPMFAPAGTLQVSAGYDRGLETWLDINHLKIEKPSTNPTEQEARAAWIWLERELLGDFPFVDGASRAHALALVVAPLVRPLIDGPIPLHLVTAPLPRTGKTKLVNVCAIAATGAPEGAEMCPPSKDNEEWRKQITATLRSGAAVVLIDNLEPGKNTDSANLAALLTARVWTARELGTTHNVRVRNQAIWTATGNNPGLSRELADRSVWIQLDPEHHDPSARAGFRHDNLERWARDNQAEVCSAAAVIIQRWISNRKIHKTSKRMGGFEQWIEVIGGILHAADPTLEADLLSNRAAMRARVSPQHDEWQSFVLAWHVRIGSQIQNVGELYQLCEDADLLDSTRGAGNERSQRTRLGRALRGVAGRIYQVKLEGLTLHLRICTAGACPRTRSKAYRLERVSV